MYSNFMHFQTKISVNNNGVQRLGFFQSGGGGGGGGHWGLGFS